MGKLTYSKGCEIVREIRKKYFDGLSQSDRFGLLGLLIGDIWEDEDLKGKINLMINLHKVVIIFEERLFFAPKERGK